MSSFAEQFCLILYYPFGCSFFLPHREGCLFISSLHTQLFIWRKIIKSLIRVSHHLLDAPEPHCCSPSVDPQFLSAHFCLARTLGYSCYFTHLQVKIWDSDRSHSQLLIWEQGKDIVKTGSKPQIPRFWILNFSFPNWKLLPYVHIITTWGQKKKQ